MGHTEIDLELERRLLEGFARYQTPAADQQQIVDQVMSILLANRMLEFVRTGAVQITGLNSQGEIQFGITEAGRNMGKGHGEPRLDPDELMRLEKAVRAVVQSLGSTTGSRH